MEGIKNFCATEMLFIHFLWTYREERRVASKLDTSTICMDGFLKSRTEKIGIHISFVSNKQPLNSLNCKYCEHFARLQCSAPYYFINNNLNDATWKYLRANFTIIPLPDITASKKGKKYIFLIHNIFLKYQKVRFDSNLFCFWCWEQ